MQQATARTHITRRSFIKGVGLLSASVLLFGCTRQSGDAPADKPLPLLAIVHTNDTHGHDVETKTTDNSEGNFSMAAVAALKAELQAEGYEVILVDAGDATQGTPLVDISKGETAISFMNSCGYDLMAIGNHEFDWGLEALGAHEKAATFPLLSANILLKDTGEHRFTANKIVELSNGTKVGFFGLTTPATLTTTNPNIVEGFRFLTDEELFACAQEQVNELRKQGCDLVVCVGHLGNEAELAGSTSKDVIQNVTGIDLFIDGHDHQQVEEQIGTTLLLETGCNLNNIGVILIDEGLPVNEPVAYGTFDGIDTATQAIIDAEYERTESELGVVLGETPFFLDGNRDPGLRTQETNLGDFVADAFKWTTEQELGITLDGAVDSGGGIRTSINAGDITLRNLREVKPFSNTLVALEITGELLLEALEAGCQNAGGGEPLGGFPQVAGINFTVDTSVPFQAGPAYPNSVYLSPAAPGTRVTITDVGGRAFDPAETYTIATTNFLAAGGDTYYAFKKAADLKQPSSASFDYETLVSYLVVACDHQVPDVYAKPQGRITLL